MLTEIKIKCNGIPYSVDDAVRYSMPIDKLTALELAELIDKELEDYPDLSDELEKAEELAEDWEQKFDDEQERADIAVDNYENTKTEIEELEEKHAEEMGDLEELLFKTEERLKNLISIAEL